MNPCKVCGLEGQIHRSRELTFGDTTITIETPLCSDCADGLPLKVVEALQSPAVRVILKTLGIRFDLDEAAQALKTQPS